jgi:hypothetical protein
MNTGAPILVKPSNNIYTALAGVATLVSLLALIAVCVKASQFGWLSSWMSP